MKKRFYNILFIIILLAFCEKVLAQVEDDFSDGNFTENPEWIGDDTLFIVNSSHQLQLNDVDVGKAALATEHRTIAGTEWRFWIKMPFAPSNNNFAQVYLAADQADLKEPLNGYFLRFGENGSNDAIELYRQEGTSTHLICRGTDGAIAASFTARIKVTCDDNDTWTLFADMAGGNAFQEIASGSDVASFECKYLGVFCQYTKSNATKFYFDDFYAGPIHIDTEPPKLQRVSVTSATTLELIFDEVIMTDPAQNVDNYTVMPGYRNPLEALLQPDGKSVFLTFSQPFSVRETYVLTVQNMVDMSGNIAHSQEATFSWYASLWHDILINEIMARPAPVVGLPDAAYVELYNNSDFTINLNGWSLVIGTSTKHFGDYDLLPHEYLILCHNNNKEALSVYGNCYGFSTFSLTYGGTSLTLYSPEKEEIAYVRYSDTWYGDDNKKNGGWSLERIDPNNGCDWAHNWIASNSPLGGTPGAQNSVFKDNPEVIAPELVRATYIDPQTIMVFFNKPMNPASISDVAQWNADQGLGNPENVTPESPDYTSATIVFSGMIEEQKLYTLTLKADGVVDCSGLAMQQDGVIHFGKPEKPKEHDVLINEIMAHPAPVVGLPDAAYIELFNNTDYPINMNGWTLVIGNSTKTFENYDLAPREYLILCHNNNKELLAPYGNCYGFSSFSLAQAGTSITLYTSDHEMIAYVRYSDTWYGDDNKKNGGWSLERIDPNNGCDWAHNWIASNSPLGGTPGAQNSVFKDNPEVIAPELVRATYIDPQTITVFFNKPMNPASISDVAQWNADQGLGNPENVTPESPDYTSATIVFSGTIEEQKLYTLTLKADGVVDCSGLAMQQDGVIHFGKPEKPKEHDVLINEIMAHPAPVVGLPDAAYIELFNNTDYPINMNGWTLVIGNSTKTFENYDLAPREYLILCHNNNKELLAPYGNCYGFSSFSLAQAGTSITLYTSDHEMIAYVRYSDTWYGDDNKKNGGWSLERIDPNNGCDWAHNWIASNSPLGGTPGAQNSVFKDNPEVIAPELVRATYIDPQTIMVFFNKPMNPASISDVAQWNADQGLGNPENVTPESPDYTSATIVFSGMIEEQKLYTLTLKADGVVDCSGLAMQQDGVIHFGKPEKPKEHDVLINEIMAHPAPVVGLPDAAYIELFNNTDYPINMNGWTLVIGNSTKTFENYDLAPREYLILCHNNHKEALSVYGSCYGFSTFSLTYGGTSLALYTNELDLMAYVHYSDTWYGDDLKKEGGWSLERIDPDNDCDLAHNWMASKAPLGGTPGSRNSVLQKNPEITTPELLRAEYVDYHTIIVFFNKTMNASSIADPALWNADHGLGNPVTVTLEAPDFTTATLVFEREIEDREIYTLILKAGDVFDCGNVLMERDGEVKFGKPTEVEKLNIVINEVMFGPTGLQYVELYNRSASIFDTKSLRFVYEDMKGKQSACKVPPFLLFPDEYAVLTKHKDAVIQSYRSNVYAFIDVEGMPTLSTSTGILRIAKAADSSQVIDAMAYETSMHSAMLNTTSGVSLERISPERPSNEETNWHSASSDSGFGTPGYKNSQFDDGKADHEISIDPEVFTPNNDGIDDVLNIRYKFDEAGYVANIYIYNSFGRFVRRLANNVIIGTEGAFSWDGKDDNHKLSNAGIYIIVVEIFNLQGKTKKYKKTGTLGVRF